MYYVPELEKNLKMSFVLKLNYWFNTISVEILLNFCVKIDKLIPKFIWKYKVLRIAKTILKKNNIGRLASN